MKINLLKSITIIFLLKLNVFSLIFVDVDVVRNENRDLIRFVEYDTRKHRFQSIKYYQIEDQKEVKYALESSVVLSFMKEDDDFKINILNINFDTHALRIHKQNIKGVTYLKKFADKKYYRNEDLYFWKDDSGIDKAKTVSKKVMKKSPAYSQFKIELLREEQGKKSLKKFSKDFSTIFNAQVDNNYERGLLGELATELSMLSSQYYYHSAKIEGNHGFDGVYIDDSDDPEIFITESKCRSESKSAQKYLEEQLSANKIDAQLVKMARNADLKKLSKRIRAEILNGKVFTMAHRIFDGGNSEFAVEQLTEKKWLESRLPKTKGNEYNQILGRLQQLNLGG